MPTFRLDFYAISPYRPGRSADDVTAETGISDVVKMASNESPERPFPEAISAATHVLSDAHHYPDNRRLTLTNALSDHLGVPAANTLTGGASNEITLMTGLACGGPGTSAVFAEPSFPLYRIATLASGATPMAVPLDAEHRHDLDAMAAAIRPDTTVVYVCNPNNPTGTHISTDDVAGLIDAIPDKTLIVVDEAYAEYATAADYHSLAAEAAARPNLMVTRTFSKIYGLAGAAPGTSDGTSRSQPQRPHRAGHGSATPRLRCVAQPGQLRLCGFRRAVRRRGRRTHLARRHRPAFGSPGMAPDLSGRASGEHPVLRCAR
ncbi:aminotransferase class I/II-fold pyridoxal phosphate-dependent enzyme [bacterium]|nr:aminotransferase class I/II-fold pyridoxal phosphate-dependent enzyme [bacterium]